MLYLETVEPGRDQRLEPFAPSSIARMRPNRERTGLVRYPDRIFDRKTLLRNERAAIATEVSHERISKIVHHASRDQCARNVRTSDGSTVRLLKDFIQRDR